MSLRMWKLTPAAVLILALTLTAAMRITTRSRVHAQQNPLQLTSAANTSIQPSWSRDGSRIAFASNRNGLLNFEIYTMSASGNGPMRITANTALDLAASW